VTVGATFVCVTVTVTVDAGLSAKPSLTTSENVNVVAEDGAVKVGFAAVVLESVTVGPPVCCQA
jgi:hypothetical protein